MKCPNCKKGDILFDMSLDGMIFKRKKIYTYFCPLCDFKNVKIIKIKEEEYQVELEKKSTNNTWFSRRIGGQI